jgi:hypothetical protein
VTPYGEPRMCPRALFSWAAAKPGIQQPCQRWVGERAIYAAHSLTRRSQQVMRLLCGYAQSLWNIMAGCLTKTTSDEKRALPIARRRKR